VEQICVQLANGVLVGVTIALIALGLSLVFGILHIVNLSHGEFYMLGAYFAWAFYSLLHNFWLSVLAAIICTALLGGGLLMLFFKQMLGAEPLRWALLTLGFGYILREAIQFIVGTDFKMIDLPVEGTLPWIGGAYRVLVMVLGLCLVFGLTQFLERTRFGLFIRAVASNEDAASVVGVSTRKIYFIVSVVSAGLAGAAGAFMLPVTSAYPTMGLEILIMAFVVVVVGGMGNVRGTLIASILAGELQSLLTIWIKPSAAMLMALIIFMGIIVARPSRGLSK
jgi:branched-chain amino acid transport system permease protein